jgi:hypothetical protein
VTGQGQEVAPLAVRPARSQEERPNMRAP